MQINYKLLLLMILMPVVGHGASSGYIKPGKTGFPKTMNDVSFQKRMEYATAGYKPYQDAVEYQQINTESEETYLQRMEQRKQMFDPKIEVPQNIENNTPAVMTVGAGSAINESTPHNINAVVSGNENAQNQQQNSGVRSVCFSKDTKSPKRFIPPTAGDGIVYWWVGDSRFTGMYINGVIGRQPNEAVVAQAGKGLEWFTTSPRPTGRSLLDSCLRAGDVVILNLGANDIWKYDKYISTYKELMSAYPNVIFKIVSVNPVYDGKAKLKNAKIETFNNRLRTVFPHNYVDTYSIVKPYVTANTTDSEGLHYRGGGIEQKIYDTVMQSVQ